MSNEALLVKIAGLKAEAQEYENKLQEAKIRQRLIADKLVALDAELSEALGTSDWDSLGVATQNAETDAQEAAQALGEALEAAGVTQ